MSRKAQYLGSEPIPNPGRYTKFHVSLTFSTVMVSWVKHTVKTIWAFWQGFKHALLWLVNWRTHDAALVWCFCNRLTHSWPPTMKRSLAMGSPSPMPFTKLYPTIVCSCSPAQHRRCRNDSTMSSSLSCFRECQKRLRQASWSYGRGHGWKSWWMLLLLQVRSMEP